MTLFETLRLTRQPARAFAIIGLFWGAFAAHVPVFKAGLGDDDGQFGLLLLGTSFGLVSAMWLAPRIDRTLGDAGLPVVALAFAAVFVFPALAHGPSVFFVALLVLGFMSGLTDVVMNARVSELEGLSGAPLMNANHGVFSAAYAISAIFSGLAREAGVGPVAVFGALAVVCIPLALSARPKVAVVAPATSDARAAMVMPVVLCGAVVLIAFMTEATVETWSALHVERTLGGRAAQGAAGPAVLGLTMAVGRFSGQAATARFSEFFVLRAGAVLAICGVATVAIAPVPVIAYLGFAAVGLGVSVIGPIGLALTGRLVPESQRTRAIARVAVIGFAGFFIAPVIMGQLSDGFGLRAAFAIFGVVLVLVFPLVSFIRRLPGVQG
ncbi:MAG TPA: MFS transporter [Rhodobacteraceae bacterium]|nr:MFS transporter [Paracoccaceae bacterium]